MKWVYDRQTAAEGWIYRKRERQSAANIGALAYQVDTPSPFSKTCLGNVRVT